MGPLTKEIPQIELRSILEVIRLRWWIVPLCLLVSAGLMFSQESDLRSVPASTTVTKIYGAKDETAVLGAFGVDSTAIKEFPSFQNQLAIVRAQGPQLVASAIGTSLEVAVTRAEPQVSMLAAADGDGKQLFTVAANGASNYVFSCSAHERDQCDKAINVYVHKVEVERSKSISEGLLQLETQIRTVLSATTSDQSALQLQATAIHSMIGSVTGRLAYVSEIISTSGGTISTVKASTYLFALAVGLIIALLIILQLTVTDNKIRSAKKLQSAIDAVPFLGELTNKRAPVESSVIAAAIVVKARQHQTQTVVLIPIGPAFTTDKNLRALQSTDLSAYVTLLNGAALESMSVRDLVDSNAGYILVIQKNVTTSHEIMVVFEALVRSGNLVLGTILTDL